MTKEEKKTLIQGQIESGLSQIEFCKQHNLNLNSFHYCPECCLTPA